MNNDKKTDKFIDDLESLMSAHFLTFEDEEYREMISSTLIAISTQMGRLKWICEKSGEVKQDNFDTTMWNIISNTFDELQAKDSRQH